MSGRPVNVVEGHRVPLRLLDETFGGPVSASTMAELRASQHSRRLLLLKVVLELAPDEEDAWRTLVSADRRSPDAVRQVLTCPAVGTWLVRAIRIARGDTPGAEEMDYLGSVAAAAAIRAGVPASVEVPVWHGRVNLPTIGQFVTGSDTARHARVRHTDSGTHIEIDGRVAPHQMLPLRRHRSQVEGVGVWWTIDDIDPYREFATAEPPNRLDDEEYAHWCGLLDEAWALLVRQYPGYAAELAHVDPIIVPVPRDRGLVASSSSSSFGAIVIAPPESVSALAETLVHELQHSKLNAVLDLVRLEDSSAGLCYASWRRDPRPLSGLLHGIYAFMSVVEYWRGQRHVDADRRGAEFKFLYRREQVRAALRVVDGMPELTEFGRRLVDAVSARLAVCDTEVVPDELTEPVALMLAEHRVSWRLRHLAPPDELVEDAARRWLVGDAPPSGHDSVLAPENRAQPDSSLSALLRVRALGLDGVADIAADRGERALGDGRRAEAARVFATRIAANPEDDGAWVGLFVAQYGADDLAPVESVSATYRRLRVSRAAPDPVTLADWFANRIEPG